LRGSQQRRKSPLRKKVGEFGGEENLLGRRKNWDRNARVRWLTFFFKRETWNTEGREGLYKQEDARKTTQEKKKEKSSWRNEPRFTY